MVDLSKSELEAGREAVSFIWNPCPDCAAALRYALRHHGPSAMGVLCGKLIRTCLTCSKHLPALEAARKMTLNLPDETEPNEN